MTLLIKNGRLITDKEDYPADIFIENNTGTQNSACLHFEGRTNNGWPTFNPISESSFSRLESFSTP